MGEKRRLAAPGQLTERLYSFSTPQRANAAHHTIRAKRSKYAPAAASVHPASATIREEVPATLRTEQSDSEADDEEGMQGGLEEETGGAYNRLLGLLSNAGVVTGQRHDREKGRGRSVAASNRQLHHSSAGNVSGRNSAKLQAQEPEAGALQGAMLKSVQSNGSKTTEPASAVPLGAAAGRAARAEVIDPFTQHFERQLSQEDIAQLRSALPEFISAQGALLPGVWPGATCQISGSPLQEAPQTLAHAGVQPRLITRWREVHEASAGKGNAPKATRHSAAEEGAFETPEQRTFFGLCASYKGIFFPLRPYPTSLEEGDLVMDAYLLHCINHVYSAAALIKRNNDRLKVAGDGAGDTPRDQGFTRAKVLILLPLRSVALRVVSRLLELAQKENRADSIQNKQRFIDDFGGTVESDDEEEEGVGGDAGEPKQVRAKSGKKGGLAGGTPAEHAALFGGNSDDHFRLGIKVTRGAIKLYADFLQSDIIVASPIALATKLAEPPPEEGGGPADFLSSIEIAVVDRADVLLMQNWAHVVTVFEAMNKVPEAQHGTDIMRVREHFLSGNGAACRQTIMLSSFASAEMNALFNRTCANWAGRVKLRVDPQGVLGQVIPQVRQMFERLPAASAAADADARFEHFRGNLWPRMKETGAKGQLIFVASYFDYVRLRNFLKAEDAAFAGLSEYAAPKQAARGRSLFADGRLPLALLTERSHFYNRARVRGVKDLLFYQLPHHAHFYPEMVNLLRARDESAVSHATVSVLFTKYDALRLKSVTGALRAEKMLKGKTSTFLFC